MNPIEITDEVTQKVFAILTAKSPRRDVEIDADTPLDALGIDSLDMVEVLYELENAFGIVIPDNADVSERFSDFATAGSVVAVVRRLLQEAS